MSETWSVPGWAVLSTLAALALVALVLALALVRSRSAARAALAAARTDVAALQTQVEAIEQRLARPAGSSRASDAPEFVITLLGDEAPDHDPAPRPEPAVAPATRVPGPLFADLVLREGVVQTAALAAGVRRALAPEARHKIRLEMRREVKRARKQRKADQREARREWESRQRAAGDAA